MNDLQVDKIGRDAGSGSLILADNSDSRDGAGYGGHARRCGHVSR
jgi:hypothetical protein